MKLKAEPKFAALEQRAKAIQAKFGPDPRLVAIEVAEALCPPPDTGHFDNWPQSKSLMAKQFAEYIDRAMFEALTKGQAVTVGKIPAGETVTLDTIKRVADRFEINRRLDAQRDAFLAELEAYNKPPSIPDQVAAALCPPETKSNKDDMLDAFKYSFGALHPWKVHQAKDLGVISCV